MQATSELIKEHQAAMLMLEVLEKISNQIEKGEKAQAKHAEKILSFFAGFVNHCKHAREEQLLIPGMSRHQKFGALGMPEDVESQAASRLQELLAEHKQVRKLLRSMELSLKQYQNGADHAGREFAKTARAYIKLLIAHIAKGVEEIFPLADQILSKKEQEKLGFGRHKEYRQLLKRLKGIYLLD